MGFVEIEPSGIDQSPPQQEFHLSIDAPQLVPGPTTKGVEDARICSEEKGLSRHGQ